VLDNVGVGLERHVFDLQGEVFDALRVVLNDVAAIFSFHLDAGVGADGRRDIVEVLPGSNDLRSWVDCT
jgi:hypothetical protein